MHTQPSSCALKPRATPWSPTGLSAECPTSKISCIHPFIHPSIHPSTHPSIHLSVLTNIYPGNHFSHETRFAHSPCTPSGRRRVFQSIVHPRHGSSIPPGQQHNTMHHHATPHIVPRHQYTKSQSDGPVAATCGASSRAFPGYPETRAAPTCI